MNTRSFPFPPLLMNLLFVAFAMSLGAISAAQEATPEPTAAMTQVDATAQQSTNNALMTIVIGAVVVIGLGALALAAYTSQQAAQGIPLPAFVELSKTILDAGARFALPIGADWASKTPNKLDDVAITELAKALGWSVAIDPETGKISLTAPDESKPNA